MEREVAMEMMRADERREDKRGDSQPITMKHLLDSRCIHKIEDGVKLLSVVSCHYIHFSTCNSFLF